MKKVYQVAGHKFAIIMPDDYVGWNEMGNYEPFLVEDSNSENCVFCAEMIDELPDIMEKRPVIYNKAEKGFPRIDLYEIKGGWLLSIAPESEVPVVLYILANKSFSQARFLILDNPRFSIDNVLMVMFSYSTAWKNTICIHASVTMHQGKGYLFLGKSGTGKSTHSQLWINNIEGCSLLNDDNPVLRVEDNGEVRVYGSPWSGKTPCYRNLVVPVGAVVDLHQAKKNVIRRLSLAEAYAASYVSFSGCRFMEDMAKGQHSTNEKIVLAVPFYSLECLPDADAALLCHKTVTQG